MTATHAPPGQSRTALARSVDAAASTSNAVDVVVVNHNTSVDLIACLRTLTAQPSTGKVIVVDAGSTDDSVAAVRRAFPTVDIRCLRNVGFARAANAGLACTESDVVVVANADTSFAATAIDTLRDELLRDATLAAVGPRVHYPDGRHQASARALPTRRQALGHALLGPWLPRNRWTREYQHLDDEPTRARPTDWISGCAIALRREAVADIGGFDPRFFLFVEDVDLCTRLRERGWNLRYVPHARVEHVVGGATSAAPIKARLEHARSLDYWWSVNGAPGLVRRLALRLGLAGWVGSHALRRMLGASRPARAADARHGEREGSPRATIADVRN